jgi:Aminoglycoside 3-N-acetyltransferase
VLYRPRCLAILLRVGADKITALHLAEHRAEYPDKRTVVNGGPLLVEGVRQWLEWEELRVEYHDFVEVTSQFDSSDISTGPAPSDRLQLSCRRSDPWSTSPRRGSPRIANAPVRRLRPTRHR